MIGAARVFSLLLAQSDSSFLRTPQARSLHVCEHVGIEVVEAGCSGDALGR